MFNHSLMRRLRPPPFWRSLRWVRSRPRPPISNSLALADSGVNPTTDSILRLADTLGIYEKARPQGHHRRARRHRRRLSPRWNSGAVDIADISIDAALRLKADNGVAIRHHRRHGARPI